MSDLSGKVTLITGASSGIGAATAIMFARRGAKLSLSGRNEANLQRVIDECMSVSPAGTEQPLMVLAEMTSEADVTRLVKATVDKFGRLDVLVNNAGGAEFDSIQGTSSLELYDRLMNLNVRSVFQLTMLCVPHLIETRGSIINVSSLAGSITLPGFLSYGMSKAALDRMTSCIAVELGPKGVRVNSVNPGVIITEGIRRAGLSDDALAQMKQAYPLGRAGEANEVAEAIAFLASSSASFIAGEQIRVDGGYHAAH